MTAHREPAGSSAGPGEVLVDARGLRCPLPVIRLAAAARDLPAGALVTVLSTDPAARHDVPAWARMRGHAMAADPETRHPDEGDAFWVLTVRLGAGA